MKFACVIAVTAASGCASPPGGAESAVPAERVRAMLAAAEAGDRSAIPAMIAGLDSDDAAVRMASIRSLERLEGTTLGYEHAAPEWERRAAADLWQERWEAEQAAIGGASDAAGVEKGGGP